MKVRYRRFFLVLTVLAILTLGACSFPEYMLEFSVDSVAKSGDYANVTCRLENTGSKPLTDAMVRFVIQANDGSIYTDWTPAVDLEVGEVRFVGKSVFVATDVFDAGYSWIEEAGWNTD